MFRLALTLTLTASLGLAACSDGDDDGASPTTAESAEAPVATAAPDGEQAEAELPPGDLEAWCLGWNGPPIPEEDGDVEGVFAAILVREEATAEVAPAEIAEASEVWLDGQRAFIDHLASFDWDLEAADARNFVDPQVDEARQTLEDYAKTNC